jgi:hypothetical protein
MFDNFLDIKINNQEEILNEPERRGN